MENLHAAEENLKKWKKFSQEIQCLIESLSEIEDQKSHVQEYILSPNNNDPLYNFPGLIDRLLPILEGKKVNLLQDISQMEQNLRSSLKQPSSKCIANTELPEDITSKVEEAINDTFKILRIRSAILRSSLISGDLDLIDQATKVDSEEDRKLLSAIIEAKYAIEMSKI